VPRGSLETIAADRDFPALRYAIDSDFVLACLHEARVLAAPDAMLKAIDVLNHKPGRRCTVRYTVEGECGDIDVIGKWYHNPDHARSTHSLHEALLSADLRLPRSLYAGDEGVLIQEYITGRELRDLLLKGDTRPFAAAGRWLATLHGFEPPAGLKHKSMAHETSKTGAWARAISEAVPQWAPVVDRTLRGLAKQAAAIDEPLPVAIHRDYYPANLLWDGETLWGIDLDQMAAGDPAVDAGAFLAQLEKVAIRDAVPRGAFEAEAAAFLDAYSSRRNDGLGVRLPFFTAYTFLKVTAAEVERQRPRWRELAEAYLARACEEASRSPHTPG
jgi:aminoglycoside phosphotransferase (APT) family kinase protein